jgi:energy-coupling factor transport system ATP-binding protein
MITVRKLNHTYQKGTAFERRALTDIDLSVSDGEFVGLIGRTGSGKSTLIQHLNGLLKPESGSVIIDGADIGADKASLAAARRAVGLVFQYPEHQLFETTVFNDVAFGPRNMGCSKEETAERVMAALSAAGIDERLKDESPFDLSGGQKRRAAIAGVLACRPKTLVLDEPAAGLDPAGRGEILTLIGKMRDDLGITVILVSHSMEDVARFANRIVVINDGKIAFEGTPAEVFARDDELTAIGLAVPQAFRVISELNALGLGLPPVFTNEDAAKAIAERLKHSARPPGQTDSFPETEMAAET